jgi:hypothetical protein
MFIYLWVTRFYKSIDGIEMHVKFHLQVNPYLNSTLGLTWDSYVLSQGKRDWNQDLGWESSQLWRFECLCCGSEQVLIIVFEETKTRKEIIKPRSAQCKLLEHDLIRLVKKIGIWFVKHEFFIEDLVVKFKDYHHNQFSSCM